VETQQQPEVDPRIERTRRLVLDAAAKIVVERGFEGATIEAISEVCGVARSTIYRHWPDKSALVMQAMKSRVVPKAAPATGSVRGDLLQILGDIAGWLSAPDGKMVALGILNAAHRDPELGSLHANATRGRRSLIEAALHHGVETGELDPDLDPAEAATDLMGSLFCRLFITHEPIDGVYVEGRVDRWLAAHRPAGHRSEPEGPTP
jgi:AcrR family transcriptional regulator